MKKQIIYICYSEFDKKYAQRLTQELEHNGFSVYSETECPSYNEMLKISLTEAIESCSIFIALVTENFIDSSWCQKETIIASRSNLNIILCKLKELKMPNWLLFNIGNISTVPLIIQDVPNESFYNLIHKIKNLVETIPCQKINETDKVPSLDKLCRLKFSNDNNSEIQIIIDGNNETTLQPDEVKSIMRKPGNYVIKTRLNRTIENKFDQQFTLDNNDSIVHLNSYDSNSVSRNRKKYKCFIAGATTIVNERNAARAALSILHNEYAKFDCDILSYTFEDFSNRQNEFGQQSLYFEFIKKDADCVIFIICKRLGSKTKEEYTEAMSALTSHGSRPAIFVYNDTTLKYDSAGKVIPSDTEVLEFQKLVHSQNGYWINYDSISFLMNKIQADVNKELKEVLNLSPVMHNI